MAREPDTDDIPQDVRDAIDAAWEALPEARERIEELFYEKLAAAYPDHPWVKRWQARKGSGSP